MAKIKVLDQDYISLTDIANTKDAVKSAISFESLYDTTKTTFKILESIRTSEVVKI